MLVGLRGRERHGTLIRPHGRSRSKSRSEVRFLVGEIAKDVASRCGRLKVEDSEGQHIVIDPFERWERGERLSNGVYECRQPPSAFRAVSAGVAQAAGRNSAKHLFELNRYDST